MNQKLQISVALSQAFSDDPFYQSITVDFTEPEQKAAVLARYFELAIDEALHIGEIAVSGEDGAAVWITREVDPLQVSARESMRKAAIKNLLGSTGFENYQRIIKSMAANTPAWLEQAWYLSIIGVSPSKRGKGIAQQLLKSTLNRADRLGVRCFLETFNPLSLPFYQRAGFCHSIACFDDVTDRPYWILVRDPPGG